MILRLISNQQMLLLLLQFAQQSDNWR